MNETDVFNALKYRTYDAEYEAYVWRNSAGLLHRVDGPAVEWDDGGKEWFQNGLPHRTAGPSVELADGTKKWYIDGESLTMEAFRTRLNKT